MDPMDPRFAGEAVVIVQMALELLRLITTRGVPNRVIVFAVHREIDRFRISVSCMEKARNDTTASRGYFGCIPQSKSRHRLWLWL